MFKKLFHLYWVIDGSFTMHMYGLSVSGITHASLRHISSRHEGILLSWKLPIILFFMNRNAHYLCQYNVSYAIWLAMFNTASITSLSIVTFSELWFHMCCLFMYTSARMYISMHRQIEGKIATPCSTGLHDATGNGTDSEILMSKECWLIVA